MESLRGLTSTPASAYDELVTGQKSIRYHWQGILSVIRSLPGGLGERVESAQRQLEESGATVNLLDDRGAPRWRFDPLPVVIAPDDWAYIESGVIQRARLLNTVLADLYGPHKLLHERLVPPMLLHANRHFQRPCRVTDGVAPTRYLSHYAVDLVRLGNGRWHVLADHAEVPSRCVACWHAACQRLFARSRCAISGRSSTVGTTRCWPPRQPAPALPTWPSLRRARCRRPTSSTS